jgi:hypothetical protein
VKRGESGNLESPNLDLRNGEERETIKGRELEQVFILNGPIYIFFRLSSSTYTLRVLSSEIDIADIKFIR